MAFVTLWTSMHGVTIDDFRKVSSEHNSPQDVDGLLAWAAGTDENGLNVVSIWQSKAHQERFAAEQLFPAFQATGISPPASAVNAEYEAGEVYIR